MNQEKLMLMASQRAALMALVACIIEAGEDVTLQELKDQTVNLLSRMVDKGHMVGDQIDIHVIELAKQYCEMECAIDQVNTLLKFNE